MTLRNVMLLLLVLVIVFLGISWYFELNPRYEGLFDERVDAADPDPITIHPEPDQIEVIDEQRGVDPFLLDAAAREQYLGTKGYDPLDPDGSSDKRSLGEDGPLIEGSLDEAPRLETESDRESSRIVIEGTQGRIQIKKQDEPDDQ